MSVEEAGFKLGCKSTGLTDRLADKRIGEIRRVDQLAFRSLLAHSLAVFLQPSHSALK